MDFGSVLKLAEQLFNLPSLNARDATAGDLLTELDFSRVHNPATVLQQRTCPTATSTPTATPPSATRTPTARTPVPTRTSTPVPIVISNVHATPGVGSFTVTWTTNVPATTRVDYSLTLPVGLSPDGVDYTRVTSHQLTVSGLARQTLYYYYARSADDSTFARTQTFTVTTR
jgi:hypothetical protein